jgi:uncharacterized membrane protein YhaH (DUF805 family)
MSLHTIGTADSDGEIGLLSGVFVVGNVWVTIELGLLAGTPGPNRYGPPESAAEVAA